MKQITLSHNLNLRQDIHKNKMDILLNLQNQLFYAVNGFSTIAYYSMFENDRKDIWKKKGNLFTDDKEKKKVIIQKYIDYLDKNFNTFSHKRYYLYITNEINKIYSNYNYRFLKYSRFILKNINKKVSDLYNDDVIVLYKPRKNIKKDLNREDYPLNELVIKKISEKLEKFSISDENIKLILNEFSEKYSLLDKIEVDKEFILNYNPDFVFRKYFFRVDDSDFIIPIPAPEKLSDKRVIKLMKRYNLVKYLKNKIKPTYLKTLDVSLFNDGITRQKYGKDGLLDVFETRKEKKELILCG